MKVEDSALAGRVSAELKLRFSRPERPGGRLPSVRTLARSLGVSVDTIRAAQRLLEGEGLLEIRHGSGVYLVPPAGPARIAIVSEMDILHPHYASFFAREVRELRRFFRERGFETDFYMGESLPGEHRQEPTCGRFIQEANARNVAGAVLINAPETEVWRTFIDACPIPLVGANTPFHAGVDYHELVRAGLRVLAEQGGRRVAVLGWSDGNACDAFLLEAAREAGLQSDPRWIRHDLHPHWRGAGWEMFREIWSGPQEKPDSLLVTDDLLFSEAVMAIAELGIRVPRDLRVAAHANAGDEKAAFFPVTRLRVDAAWCADRLGETLLRLMAGEKVKPGLVRAPVEVELAPAERPKGARVGLA